MRDVIGHLIDNARRSGDRIGVDGTRDAPTQLGADAIRLARLATSIHLAETARRLAESEPAADRAWSVRESAR
ncbi:MAG: hypothetical protein SYC29_04475 [Planctomycetota bacterium]|nr:hypothetical protein [Planctomycetota bacterium]